MRTSDAAPQSSLPRLSRKTLSSGCARARARALNPIFRPPLQLGASGNNPAHAEATAVNLATAKALQFIARSFSALLRVRGQRTHSECSVAVCNARRSAPRFSVDWQASGTQRGLCWQATRDGLRHGPAGPPKSHSGENPSTLDSKHTRQLRLSARRVTISVEHVSQSIQTNATRETAV